MQVSAQPRSQPSGGKYRAHAADAVAAIDAAVDQSVGRGRQPGGASRDEQSAVPDPRSDKSGHKTVFLARSLSSTLTELQIASGADEALGKADRCEGAVSGSPVSLDELLSSFLSAA